LNSVDCAEAKARVYRFEQDLNTFRKSGRKNEQIIKRRTRFHESAFKALTICIVFVFCRDFSWFFYPIAVPTIKDNLTQTESFEYTEWTGASSVLSG